MFGMVGFGGGAYDRAMVGFGVGGFVMIRIWLGWWGLIVELFFSDPIEPQGFDSNVVWSQELRTRDWRLYIIA